MVKPKLKRLSPDELLERALVKDKDKPYEVPQNWIWTKLNYINNYAGTCIDPSKTKDKMFELYSVPSCNINYPEIIIGNEIGSTKQKVSKGDVLLCKINPRINRVWLVSQYTDYELIASSEWIVISNKTINSQYLKWCLKSKYFREYLLSNVSGVGGSLMRAQPKFVKEYPIPIPPLAEQQRIVEIIGSLFEKLDTAKELIQNTLGSFENRKAAILHKAFIGELTAKWREENGVSLDEWQKRPLKTIAHSRAGYAFNSSKFTNKGYQIVRMGNLYNGVLDLNRNPIFFPENDIDENIIRKSKINNGDILLTLTGTKYKRDYGYAVLIETDNTILFNQRIISLTATTIETKYLFNYLKTNLFRNVFFSNETGGVNQGNVSSKFVENILIPVPTQSEQKEIVRILDNILDNEQRAKELCDVIEKIDLMKKAILARAFRGELGTNDPQEKSAVELLK